MSKDLEKVKDLKAKALSVFEDVELTDEELDDVLANIAEAMCKADPVKKVSKSMSNAKEFLDAYRKRKQNPEGMKSAMKEDANEINVASIFEGEEFSDEFKEKVTTLFEAAVTMKVQDVAEYVISELEEKYAQEFDAKVAQIDEGLEEKVTSYLELMVESWIKDNQVAIESGLKMELFENFIKGMKNVFESSYIEIPEDKVDLVEGLEEKVATLQEQLNASMDDRAELKKTVEKMRKDSLINEASVGLTDVDAEKLKSLAEDIAFEDETKFSQKLNTIKESFFAKADPKGKAPAVVSDTPVNLEEGKANDQDKQVLAEDVLGFLKALNTINK